VRFSFLLVAVVAGGLMLQASGTLAGKIPPHLSSMTAGLLSELKGKLKHTDDPVLKDAGEILKEERIHQWSSKPARIKGGGKKLADAIGLDIGKPSDWAAINKLLKSDAKDVSARHEQMKRLLKARGQTADENAILEKLANFDIAREALLKDMATEHRYTIGKNQKAVMQWDPARGVYEMRISDARDKAGKQPQQTIFRGDVELRPSEKGNDLEMVTRPADTPIETLSPEQIKQREASLFGNWTDGEDVWVIKSHDGDGAFANNSTLPVDKNNPLHLDRMVEGDATLITLLVIRGEDDSEYQFRNAYLSGLSIKADRTIDDTRDIQELPPSIINQLVASWSPPEWVDLEVMYGQSPRETRLRAEIWRLHVTYENSMAGPGDVTKIANPYKERAIELRRDIELKSAPGAAKQTPL
jgi:hypothetical protein